MRNLRQQVMQRISNMPPIQPKILTGLILAARIFIPHTRQLQPVPCVIRTDGVQLLVAPRLDEAVFVVQDIGEQRVQIDVPDDGVSMLVGEGGGHGFEARVVVGDLGPLGGADVGEFGGAVEGGDTVEDEVAGAVGVELWGGVSICLAGCLLGG